MAIETFAGFSKKTIDFFVNLQKNNNKEWFDRNRDIYDRSVMAPARAFVVALGERLQAVSPDLVVDPRVNKSIFRIYRDTRFSLDKSPYKTHLGIYFWDKNRSKMESSGFYFHLEPPRLMLGAGIYNFPKPLLYVYRKSVVDEEYGEELKDIIEKIKKSSRFKIGRKHYKRIPFGFDSGHPNSELLLYNALYASFETQIPKELFSSALLDYCLKIFIKFNPLHEWLLAMANRTAF
jgi:uncharacterized protein (TIGR02453 family)